MQGNQIGERIGAIDHRKEKTTVVVHVIPVVDGRMDLSDDEISVVLVIELNEAALDAWQKRGRRGTIVTNHELPRNEIRLVSLEERKKSCSPIEK